MKPFDLEAAKRGEPIHVLFDGTWTDAHFVGMNRIGHVVTEGTYQCGAFATWTTGSVRMAPKKRTVYVNLYAQENPLCRGKGQFGVWHDTADAAEASGDSTSAIALAVPIEIEE
jgi:hypothetical protein